MVYSTDVILPFMFCFVIHMMGTYYLLNLLCATMMESYIHTADISAHDEIELKKSEITNFENNMNQENFFLNYLTL